MASVTWTAPALDDLDAVCRFVGRNLSRLADAFAEQVFAAADMLETFPQLGRSVAEADLPEIRELLVQSYRVVYRYEQGNVEILAIIHAARRLDPRSFMN